MKAVRIKVISTSLGALFPVVPGAAAVTTVVLYLADWPYEGNRGRQLAVGLAIGAGLWILASIIAGKRLTSVQGASGETYEELCGRVLAADARLTKLEGEQLATIGRKEAVASARELVDHLKKSLSTPRRRRGRLLGPLAVRIRLHQRLA